MPSFDGRTEEAEARANDPFMGIEVFRVFEDVEREEAERTVANMAVSAPRWKTLITEIHFPDIAERFIAPFPKP